MSNWIKDRIKQDQIDKYLVDGNDFIDDKKINQLISDNVEPTAERIEEILEKSLSIETLTMEETSDLIKVKDPELLKLMRETALKIKLKVYDNRIVMFAPLYLANLCVNNCAYCGFRTGNDQAKRRVLEVDEVVKEAEALAGDIGHKRLIVVYGEHPSTGIDYMTKTIDALYKVKVQTKNGYNAIRRVNVNAAPMQIGELKRLKDVGIGTYQVFQETYNRDVYSDVHPEGTLKGNYRWRLYSMHRAMEAGIDDVGLGALFGLGDWRFEVLALVAHSRELERVFKVGPHTLSFPRLEPAQNADCASNSKHLVSDEDFKRLIMILRLSVPHTGMIITAREKPQIRREAISVGFTQTDASTQIGIGAYSQGRQSQNDQHEEDQQFLLGDTRSLDEVIREYAQMGFIISFCTAGYRCGRTGGCIMDMLKSGQESKLCKMNAILTFREWLDDFASEETKAVAYPLLDKEINEVKEAIPDIFPKLMEAYEKIKEGQRDIFF